jgi:hypothetical protein
MAPLVCRTVSRRLPAFKRGRMRQLARPSQAMHCLRPQFTNRSFCFVALVLRFRLSHDVAAYSLADAGIKRRTRRPVIPVRFLNLKFQGRLAAKRREFQIHHTREGTENRRQSESKA